MLSFCTFRPCSYTEFFCFFVFVYAAIIPGSVYFRGWYLLYYSSSLCERIIVQVSALKHKIWKVLCNCTQNLELYLSEKWPKYSIL